MSIKHYDVVRAASPSDLAEKLTHKLKEGWQPYGGPVASSIIKKSQRRRERVKESALAWGYSPWRNDM